MVGDYPVARTALVLVLSAHKLFDRPDDRHKKLRIVVAELALFYGDDTLEAHPGIYRRLRQRSKVPLFVAFVLHEYEVPYLQKAVALSAQIVFGTVEVLLSLVVEYLAAGSAGAGIAHLPEVVLVAHAQNAVARYMLRPDLLRLVVALMYGDPEPIFRQLKDLGDELPCIGYCILFEVVSETEISEHLEKGVVSGGMAHILEVVVLSARPYAGLATRRPRRVGCRNFTGKNALERDHSGIGEKKCGIVGHEGRTLVYFMPFGCEVIQKSLSDIHSR